MIPIKAFVRISFLFQSEYYVVPSCAKSRSEKGINKKCGPFGGETIKEEIKVCGGNLIKIHFMGYENVIMKPIF
jgi:hypothetical protein